MGHALAHRAQQRKQVALGQRIATAQALHPARWLARAVQRDALGGPRLPAAVLQVVCKARGQCSRALPKRGISRVGGLRQPRREIAVVAIRAGQPAKPPGVGQALV